MNVAVLADDTTGALEMGALLAEAGLDCKVALNPEIADANAVVFDTRTRHLCPDDAEEVIKSYAQKMRDAGVEWIYKKTDSTLRGSIAAELRALLDVFADRGIMYVPAYPRAGRTVMNGILLVNGVPVGETEFAQDVRGPVRQSSVVQMLTSAGLAVVDDLRPGAVVVCDGATDIDLRAIADALKPIKANFIAAGPGGFARYWTELIPHNHREHLRKHQGPPIARRWLLVCGSLHPAARLQARYAASLGIDTLLSPDARTGNSVDAGTELAREVVRMLNSRDGTGLIIFGGDTAAAVFKALECAEITPLRELLPGIPLSVLKGSIPVITKAGGFGGESIVVEMLDKVKQ